MTISVQNEMIIECRIAAIKIMKNEKKLEEYSYFECLVYMWGNRSRVAELLRVSEAVANSNAMNDREIHSIRVSIFDYVRAKLDGYFGLGPPFDDTDPGEGGD